MHLTRSALACSGVSVVFGSSSRLLTSCGVAVSVWTCLRVGRRQLIWIYVGCMSLGCCIGLIHTHVWGHSLVMRQLETGRVKVRRSPLPQPQPQRFGAVI